MKGLAALGWENIKSVSGRLLTAFDSDSVDAFGRLRVSEPYTIFDNKQVYDNEHEHWEELLVGTATSTHVPDEASTDLAIGTASGDRAVRQTRRYFTYIPGKSHLIQLTGVMPAGKTNLTSIVGYGDDFNGLFFANIDSVPTIIERTDTSGTAVDTQIPQSDWNLGTGGILLDLSKAQIFIIDLQWLGVGRVRYGFNIDGHVHYVHEVNHANNSIVPYMRTPNLPIRYEIVNTGTTASASTLKQICCSVVSEGGYTPPGRSYSAGNREATQSVTVRTPIFAIRLKNTYNSKPNRKTILPTNLDLLVTTNEIIFEVVKVRNPTSTTGGTWIDVDTGHSVAEWNDGITAITGGDELIILERFATTAAANKSSALNAQVDRFAVEHAVLQNFDSTNSDLLVVFATPVNTTPSDINAILEWIEIE